MIELPIVAKEKKGPEMPASIKKTKKIFSTSRIVNRIQCVTQ